MRARRSLEGGTLVLALALGLGLASRVGAHDETTMTAAEGARLTERLVASLGSSEALASLDVVDSSPGDLRRRLARRPEVKELIHLRTLSAPIVTDRLRALSTESPSRRRDVVTSALVHVLEQSRFLGAVPALLVVAAVAPASGDAAPHLATQALKSLTGQDGQDFGAVRFTDAARLEAVARGRAWAEDRLAVLIEEFASTGAFRVSMDASGVDALEAALAADPQVRELAFLCAVDGAAIAAQLDRSPAVLAERDVETATFAWVAGQGRCPGVLPALIAALEAHAEVGDAWSFAHHFLTRALVSLTGQREPHSDRFSDSDTERQRVLGAARAYLLSAEKGAQP